MVDRILAQFPGLRASKHQITSPATHDYNCIAWAANDTMRWWWPDPNPENTAAYWPEGLAREESLEVFLAAFATLGYSPCPEDSLEAGYSKIAIFAVDSVPTHAARQLPNGFWTSKLGRLEDIEHDLSAIQGDIYGTVAAVLRRAIT